MNIEMHKAEKYTAWYKYVEYRRAVKKHKAERLAKINEQAAEAGKALGKARIEKTRLEKEDEQLRKAFYEMYKGRRIINMVESLKKAGIDNRLYMPKLAISRADCTHVELWCSRGGIEFRPSGRDNAPRNHRGEHPNVIKIDGEFDAALWNGGWRNENKIPSTYHYAAKVPQIPPEYRPNKLDEYYIIWEPEWVGLPPPDPILAKRISSVLYAVVAIWDMTPLERSILETR